MATTRKTFAYVSNAEDGDITRYELTAAGSLRSLGKTKSALLVMPMALSPDNRHLYAMVRTKPFCIVTYAINTKTGALKELARAPVADTMSYLSIDRTGRWLLQACYGSSLVAVNKVDADGVARAPASQVLPAGLNAHSILTHRNNKFAYVCCLGSNEVLQFRFDDKTGMLTPNSPAAIKARPGTGPRHLAFSPDGKFLYVLGELTGTVTQFAVNAKTGVLREVDCVASVAPSSDLQPGKPRQAMTASSTSAATSTVGDGDATPRIWAADIHITPNGRFLYTTERTHSHINLMHIAPKTGRLTYVASYATEKQPRGIGLDAKGRHIIAAGEKSDRISLFDIDGRIGALSLKSRKAAGADANWVVIRLAR